MLDRSARTGPEEGTEVLADLLLAWYRPEKRDVPWRHARDAYAIWVGEVMAQQTRMDTVRSYHARFLERFPTASALADADLDEVLKVWEGMGYYGRARNLHAAAREVCRSYGGRLPPDRARLEGLPGIGRYTAGAVASLAFGLEEPAVDGNARRVLSRLFDMANPSPALLHEAVLGLMGSRPGCAAHLNQALMDLGAGICTPRSPRCGSCPAAGRCLALARGTVARRPAPRRRGPLPHQTVGVGVVWREGRVLIARRPPSGLLGGLWEFPGGKLENGESPADAVRRELREEVGIEVRVGDLIDRVDHAYSHFRVTLHFYEATYVSGRARARAATAVRWVEPRRLVDFAFPTASLPIVRRLQARPSSEPGSPT